MKRLISGLAGLCLTLSAGSALADDACLYGSATYPSGSKVDGTSTITTSWNGVKGFPKDGRYRFCLGSNPKKRITVYLDGKRYAEVYVDGNTRLDILKR